MKKNNSRLVYSTELGKICPSCGKPVLKCICKKNKKIQQNNDGIIRVSRETKGRKGKGMTIIKGIPLPEDDLFVLSKKLKQKCGAGGTLKDGVIEIQGEHRDTIVEELKKLGFNVKRTGG